MILDGHIHINQGPVYHDKLKNSMLESGVDGGVLISIPPCSFSMKTHFLKTEERLDNLLKWKGNDGDLYTLFWIDPLEADALDQVESACASGVNGFKIICNKFYPDDERAMKVYKSIAAKGKPILFHSGILWDGQDSSRYNRPYGFEALINIEGLRFSLAHVSWPWYDECIAVYGKFINVYSNNPDISVEMFIDITPGTPPIYREEVITKLYKVGYDVENNIIFGCDSFANEYNTSWVKQWINRDNGIYEKLGLSESTISKIYSENLKRFLGITAVSLSKKPLLQGE